MFKSRYSKISKFYQTKTESITSIVQKINMSIKARTLSKNIKKLLYV